MVHGLLRVGPVAFCPDIPTRGVWHIAHLVCVLALRKVQCLQDQPCGILRTGRLEPVAGVSWMKELGAPSGDGLTTNVVSAP